MQTSFLALSCAAIAAACALDGCSRSPQAEAASESAAKSAAKAAPTVDLATAAAEIRGTDARWLAAARTRDAAKVVPFWTDDAVLLFPGMPPVIGRRALTDYVATSFKDPDFTVTFGTDTIVVASSGDMAYEIGRDTITYNDGSKRVTTMNNGVVIWRKQPDGQWKAAVDIGTPAPGRPK